MEWSRRDGQEKCVKAIGSENMDVEGVGTGGVGDGTVKPAVRMIKKQECLLVCDPTVLEGAGGDDRMRD